MVLTQNLWARNAAGSSCRPRAALFALAGMIAARSIRLIGRWALPAHNSPSATRTRVRPIDQSSHAASGTSNDVDDRAQGGAVQGELDLVAEQADDDRRDQPPPQRYLQAFVVDDAGVTAVAVMGLGGVSGCVG